MSPPQGADELHFMRWFTGWRDHEETIGICEKIGAGSVSARAVCFDLECAQGLEELLQHILGL